MSTRFVRLLLGATALAAAFGSSAIAKAPDLPLRYRDTCESAQAVTGALTVDPSREASARQMFLIGEQCREAGDLAMARNCYLETQRLDSQSSYARQAAERLQELDASATRDSTEALNDRIQRREARVMYELGERCRLHGDLDLAYLFYQDSQYAYPTSRYAKLAAERLREIDALRAAEARRRGASDPQQPPARLPDSLKKPAQLPGSAKASGNIVPASGTFPQTEPPPLYVPLPSRDLVLRDATTSDGRVVSASVEDLSDWLRQTIKLLGSSGSIRVEASRLTRLMSQGEQALRALGCDVEFTPDGRCFVVYPARRENR